MTVTVGVCRKPSSLGGSQAVDGKRILATVSQELAGELKLESIQPADVGKIKKELTRTTSLFWRTPGGRACSGVRYRSRPFGTSGLTPAARRIPCAKNSDAVASRLTWLR